MQLSFFKSTWGMDGSFAEQIAQIASAGYEGVETVYFDDNLDDARKLIADQGLRLVYMIFPQSAEDVKIGIERAQKLGAELVNAHGGKDWWSVDDGCRFFEGALKAIEESGTELCFETHRGRLLFEPQSTAAYLKRFPDLRITADFSHWTCVCESMLRDQDDAVKLACKHAYYTHARIGHEEGPQVPDPTADVWSDQKGRFLEMWGWIKEAHAARGAKDMRIDPEFGPRNYMWFESHTLEPVVDLWDVCLWMREELRKGL